MMTLEQIIAKYPGNDNYGQPKSQYVAKVFAMSANELLKECENKIWLSAYASNNRRSDYHWHVDVCYDICVSTGNEDIYRKAYEAVSNQ